MKEVIRMWKYSNMIALAAISAGIYMAVLIPFKSLTLIPGFTEIRPANLLPVLFGLLFGPAGAWGSAVGNLLADFFGTFSIVSLFGFAANFMYAYIPYKIWCHLGLFRYEDRIPTINSSKKLLEFGIATFSASSACALIIAWGSNTLNLIPFASSCAIISLNNTVITMLLGPVVLPFLYSRVKKLRLLWSDIMDSKDVSKPKYPRFYSWMTVTGSIGGVLAGLLISLSVAHQTVFDINYGTATSGNIWVGIGVLPFLIMIFFAAFKL